MRGRTVATDGFSFHRVNSPITPNENGECPLQCPPCNECMQQRKLFDDSIITESNVLHNLKTNGYGYIYNNEKEKSLFKQNNLLPQNSAELEIRLGTCNTRRDRIVNFFLFNI